MAKESSNLAELMTYLIQQYFPEDTLAIIPGISGSEFTQLPFDHLVFTGSANTARQVMTAAAQTLTPVTLELGGKCPCIIDKEFDLQVAAQRIINFKTFNAGQTCVAPDYVFVHEDQLQSFIKLCGQTAQSQYNSIHSKDYTSIISDNAMNRLTEYLEEAQTKGAKLHNLMGDSAVVCDQATRKLSPMLISHVPDDCRLMQEEIFGPLLPVKTYNNINEVIDYINQRANPWPYTFSARAISFRKTLFLIPYLAQ